MNNNIKPEENNLTNYESLIKRLKSQDENVIKKNKLTIVFSVILTLAWVALYIADYINEFIHSDRTFHISMFFILIIILGYRVYNQCKYKKINYAESIRETILQAEKRYRFWSQKVIFEFIILIILGIVFGIYLYTTHAENWPIFKNIAFSIFVPIFMGVFSMIRLYLDWKREKRPLWIFTKEMLRELE